MIRTQLSDSIEDYLKAIYELGREHDRVSTNQIATRLEVTAASVTGMLKRLAKNEPPLVEYQKHHGVTLTPAGKSVALEMVRHHRLLEMFLHETLGYAWDEVHLEADRLEHVISEEFEERLAEHLGHPRHDPHGSPIPSRSLQLPSAQLVTMNKLQPGDQAVVRQVEDDDPALLRYLSTIGLVPGACLDVQAYSQFDENLSVLISDAPTQVVLGPAVTRQIKVELIR